MKAIGAVLIGVCASDDMICSMLMKPTLLMAGVLTASTGLVGLVYLRGAAWPSPEPSPQANEEADA